MPTTKKIHTLIGPKKLQNRIKELAQEINKYYKKKPLIVIGVLKGSFIFMADLIRHLKMPVTCDFLRVRSYDAQGKPGLLRLEFDLTQPIQQQHILVIEDIIDTGASIEFIREHLLSKKPASLRVCSLLQRKFNQHQGIDYTGFFINNAYVVGYGMDLDGRYRELNYIGYLKNK